MQKFITVEVSLRESVDWLLITVYGSHDEQQRAELWSDLGDFGQYNSHPWLIVGDFNETRSMEECQNYSEHLAQRSFNFNNWIENNGFFNLSFSSPQFTLARSLNPLTRKAARLDVGYAIKVRGRCSWMQGFNILPKTYQIIVPF